MRRLLLAVSFLSAALPAFAVPLAAGAQTSALIQKNLQQAAEQGAGYSPEQQQRPLGVVFGIIRAFLSLLGIIFLVLMLYGGYLWMTARGNEQQVEKAKETITRAVIGLIIILSSLAITRFVFYGFYTGRAPGQNANILWQANVRIGANASWSPF